MDKLETARLQALRIFDENIFPHIIGDLDTLDKIQPSASQTGCTVPTAMLILSSLDLIGYLFRECASLDDSKGNIISALSYGRYFPPHIYDASMKKNIAVFYRHGMMHMFYPRQTTSQVYGIHKSDHKDLLENLHSDGYTIKSINVNILSKDFRAFINSLYFEIKTTNDQKLLDTMLSGYKKIYPPSLTSTTTTTTVTTIPPGVNKNK